MPDRVLVTGAAGTLGRPLCVELRRREAQTFGLDLQHVADPDCDRADVASYRELKEIFKHRRPTTVFHLAAEFGRLNGEGWYERLWQTNAIGTRHVLELCKQYDAQLIFASSSEIYGEMNEPWLNEELAELLPLDHPNEYALSKWVNEVQIRNFARRNPAMRLPIVCRFFNSYGPGETYHPYRSVVALFCYRALVGEPFSVYEGYSRTFMYMDDFIPTLANAAWVGKPGQTYNIGGVDYRSVEDLANLVMAETKADPSLIQRVGLDEHNVVSKRPDITRARADLGHNPHVLLEDGVPATLDWMKRQLFIAGAVS